MQPRTTLTTFPIQNTVLNATITENQSENSHFILYAVRDWRSTGLTRRRVGRWLVNIILYGLADIIRLVRVDSAVYV